MMAPRVVIFCCSPGKPDRLDEDWSREAEAARNAGFATALIDHDAVVAGKLTRAVARIPQADRTATAIYRGWMLTVEQYGRLFEALLAKGVTLINGPSQYAFCHHIPGWYAAFDKHTPRSRWLSHGPPFSRDEIVAVLAGWTGGAIVKDYVKSEKHAWLEACFLPDVTDINDVERVVRRFTELRGVDFAGGLVFREFVSLRAIGQHPQSGMPISNEWRLFWATGKPIACSPYWEATADREPNVAEFASLAREVKSDFFAMDLAQRQDGSWLILELGDGQVSGLPERMDAGAFYRSLAHI